MYLCQCYWVLFFCCFFFFNFQRNTVKCCIYDIWRYQDKYEYFNAWVIRHIFVRDSLQSLKNRFTSATFWVLFFGGDFLFFWFCVVLILCVCVRACLFLLLFPVFLCGRNFQIEPTECNAVWLCISVWKPNTVELLLFILKCLGAQGFWMFWNLLPPCSCVFRTSWYSAVNTAGTFLFYPLIFKHYPWTTC